MDSSRVPTSAADHQLQQHGQHTLSNGRDEYPLLSVELTDIISLSRLLESPNSPVGPSGFHGNASSATSKPKVSFKGIEIVQHTTDAIVQDHKQHPHSETTKHPGKRRNRKAHAHRFSEKKRRAKIEAKMEVLRQIIPNSHKLDKASLLDGVISRVKTLKRQIQVLQQMRQLKCPFVPPAPAAPGVLQCPSTLVSAPTPATIGLTTGTNYALPALQSNFFLPLFPPFLPVVGGGVFCSMPPYLSPNAYSDWSPTVWTSLHENRGGHAGAAGSSSPSFTENNTETFAGANLFPSLGSCDAFSFPDYTKFN